MLLFQIVSPPAIIIYSYLFPDIKSWRLLRLRKTQNAL